jgi:hypothetical protein
MNARDNDPLHAAINAKLAVVVEASSTTPGWHDAWTELGPESTEEERLRVYQAVRDSGCLPPDAGFYLVCWQIDAMASQDAEISLCHSDEQMRAIEEAHGLEEDEFWPPGKAPKEYEELRRAYQTTWDGIFTEKLEEFGEHDMARQFRADPDGFHGCSKAGQEFFHGPQEPEESDAPEWLYALVETVAGNMTTFSGPGPLGFLYQEEEGVWEIVIYPKPVELIGGADDGDIVAPGFSLDLEDLRGEFERVDAVSRQSLGYPNGEGPHVSIEGVYQGHEVFVQVLAYAPEDEEPGMKLDTRPGEA